MGDYLLLILVIFSIGWLGLLVFISNSKNLANRSFGLLISALEIWILCNFYEAEVTSQQVLNWLFRIDFASAALAAYYFLRLCVYFPTVSSFKNKLRPVKFFIGFTFLISLTPLVVRDSVLNASGVQPSLIFGPLFWFYLPVVSGCVLAGTTIMWVKRSRLSGLPHVQASYVLLGMGVSGLFAVLINLGIASFISVSTIISRLGIYSMLSLAGFTSYAMLRYRMMDIRILVKETSLYLFTAGIFGSIFSFTNQYMTKNIESSVFVFIVCLLVPYLHTKSKKWLKQERIKKGIIDIKKANSIGSLSDKIKNAGYKISDLALTATEIVLDETPAINASMYVIDSDKYMFTIEGQSGMNSKKHPSFILNDTIAEFIELDNKILVRTEVDRYLIQHKVYQHLLNLFDELESEVIVPLLVLNRLAAILVLGPKKDSKPYFVNEINQLVLIANETSTALRYVMAVSRAATETKRWAHNLNQSLKPLSQAFEFIQMDDPQTSTPEERKEVFEIIWRGMKRLGGFLHYLTHQSRIIDEELRNKYEQIPVSLAEILDKSFSTHKISIQKKEIKFINHLIPSGVNIRGHKRDLVIVIEALLSNAIRYVPKNGLIEIKTTSQEKSVLIEISNSGPIIPVDLLEKIFSEGFQIKDGFEGTGGLGLANARRIIGMHNGKIWAENLQDNSGVKFLIELPIIEVENLAVA